MAPYLSLPPWVPLNEYRRHDTQLKDIQLNDAQQKGLFVTRTTTSVAFQLLLCWVLWWRNRNPLICVASQVGGSNRGHFFAQKRILTLCRNFTACYRNTVKPISSAEMIKNWWCCQSKRKALRLKFLSFKTCHYSSNVSSFVSASMASKIEKGAQKLPLLSVCPEERQKKLL
jgi:hypothetical protein